MVGIPLGQEHMPVEAAHVMDGEDADAAKGAGGHRQDLALGDVPPEPALGVALQAVEGNGRGGDVSLQGTPGEVRRAAVFQQPVLNQLILHRPAVAHFAGGGIAAVEAHERIRQGIGERSGNVRPVQRLRHGVVDVQKRHCVAGQAGADVFRQSAVNIHLAGHGNPPGSQAGVDIAGLKAELLRKCRPALVCKGHIVPGAFVRLGPVQKRQLKLSHPGQQLRIPVALYAQLLRHIGADRPNPAVSGMGLVGHQKVQLRVLLHLNAQLVQPLNGRVAGEEILGPGAEGDDLQALDPQNRPGHREKLPDHLRALPGRAHGIIGNVRLHPAQAQVIRAVQHAAVGVAPAVDQVAVALGGSHVHDRSPEPLGQNGLRRLRAEIAQIHHQGIAAGSLHIRQGLQGVGLIFHRHRTAVQPRSIGGDHRLPAGGGKGDGKAIPGHGHNGRFYFRKIGQFHQ